MRLDRATQRLPGVGSLFTELAEQAGASDPEALARALHMVYDGAVLSARSEHDPGASAAARAAAGVLLDATRSVTRRAFTRTAATSTTHQPTPPCC